MSNAAYRVVLGALALAMTGVILIIVFASSPPPPEPPVPGTVLHYHDCHDIRTIQGAEHWVSVDGSEYQLTTNVNDVLSNLCPDIYYEGMPPR